MTDQPVTPCNIVLCRCVPGTGDGQRWHTAMVWTVSEGLLTHVTSRSHIGNKWLVEINMYPELESAHSGTLLVMERAIGGEARKNAPGCKILWGGRFLGGVLVFNWEQAPRRPHAPHP